MFFSFKTRMYTSLGLISCGVLAYQLILIQILSIVQWYHFAYMIISIALLGFGVAGSILTLYRNYLLNKFPIVTPLFIFLGGLSMIAAVAAAQLPWLRFDSYLIFTSCSQMMLLMFNYLLFMTPFLFSALTIGLIFIKFTDEIGKFYFLNLIGTGLGGIAALIVLWLFIPDVTPLLLSGLMLLAGVLLVNDQNKYFISVAGITSIAVLIFFALNPPKLVLSQYKSLSKVLNMPGTKITHETNSPYGFMQVVKSSYLRYGPGISLNYQKEIPIRSAIYVNGNWYGPIMGTDMNPSEHLLNYTTSALPYRMGNRKKVLVLNSNTGSEVSLAVANAAEQINSVEFNEVVVSWLKSNFSKNTNTAYNSRKVKTHNITARTFLAKDTSKYDLIVIPAVDAFGGGTGLTALQENYDLTIEAFNNMWRRLTDDGAISITCWIDYPYRTSLKTLSTLNEMLLQNSITDVRRHLCAVRSWGTITFIVKKNIINKNEIDSVLNFCDEMFFDILLLPDSNITPGRGTYNELEDTKLNSFVDSVLSENNSGFISDYQFNIRPSTDDLPYFSQFLKWSGIKSLTRSFGQRAIPFFEIGYLLVVVTFIQIFFAAVILIIIPLFRIGWSGRGKAGVLLYFGGIGIGYMFLEVVLIQRFIIYFGNPIYSSAAVISIMLVSSGIGSSLSSRFHFGVKTMLEIFTAAVGLILIIMFFLTDLLQATLPYENSLKIVIALIAVGLPALVLGIPFPVALKYLHERNKTLVPWAWGINGALSVVSAVAAVILSVELGFMILALFAAAAYVTAALSVRLL